MKGVSPAFASAVLVAFRPEKVFIQFLVFFPYNLFLSFFVPQVPYMSDEALLSMPDCDEVDYTMKEYNKLTGELTACQQRLNSQVRIWIP